MNAIEYSDLGAPIRGPRALTDDRSRFWHLTYNIARNEFKLRFFGSALGYVWQLMRPLLLFGVLLFVFSHVAHVSNAPYYSVALLAGIVLFTFFGEATGGAVRSVVDRENLVRKIHFPRLVIPLSIVLLASFNLALNLIVVLIFALAEGVRPMMSWLEAPLILGMLIVYCAGLAMLLSALFVHFRDIQPIWEVVCQVLFYASGILIPVELLRARLSDTAFHLLMLNPLATIVEQFRHAMIDHSALSAGQALGGWWQLVEPIGIVVAIFAIGFWVFNRSAPLIAENL
ncbi:MAG TPA: ABC transporter permease [Solirubrobacteraceae bacterium]|jgi:ABC-2 type transport system permease protein|nr:ABC transporter permease [Solirubrobacteraceae bacterium]